MEDRRHRVRVAVHRQRALSNAQEFHRILSGAVRGRE